MIRRKASKYRNVKTTVDNITFDSKKEAARYQELKLMERANQIAWLELQPKYPIEIRGKKVFEYRADFRYRDEATGEMVIEDVKGVKTDTYKLKKRCVEAYYGIRITEV